MKRTILIIGIVFLLMLSLGCVGKVETATEGAEPGTVQPATLAPQGKQGEEGITSVPAEATVSETVSSAPTPEATPAPKVPKEGPKLRLFREQPDVLLKYDYRGARQVGGTVYRNLMSTGSSGEVPISVSVGGCRRSSGKKTFHVEEGWLYELSISLNWDTFIKCPGEQVMEASSPSLNYPVIVTFRESVTGEQFRSIQGITKIELTKIEFFPIKQLPEEVESLIQVLNHEMFEVRRDAAEALGKIGEPAVKPLIQALKDEDAAIRLWAARALGEIGDTRAVEPLIHALKDEESVVRKFAAEALGKIGDPRAVEPLIQALKDENWEVGPRARTALGKIGEPAVEPLIQALKDEDKSVRFDAAIALGKIGDVRAVEPLIPLLKDENSLVRSSAAAALGEIGDTRVVEPLTKVANDQNEKDYVRKIAKEALEKIEG